MYVTHLDANKNVPESTLGNNEKNTRSFGDWNSAMPSQNCWKVLNEYLWQLHEKQQNYGELSVTQDNANDQVNQCIMSQCSVSNGAKTWLAFNSLYMILHIPHIHFFFIITFIGRILFSRSILGLNAYFSFHFLFSLILYIFVCRESRDNNFRILRMTNSNETISPHNKLMLATLFCVTKIIYWTYGTCDYFVLQNNRKCQG